MTISRLHRRLAVSGRVVAVVGLVLGVALSCSSSLEPRSDVTLLVTNETCQAGQCDSVYVLGFPSKQVNTPGGPWYIELGVVTTPTACLTIPPTATFRIGTPENPNEQVILWSNGEPLTLGTESTMRVFLGSLSASTAAFVPANAAGWAITLPSGSHATPAANCSRPTPQ